jgi:hypothetical protein
MAAGKIAALIMAAKKPGGDEDSTSADDGGDLEEAMQALAEALASKDYSAAAEAFRSAHDALSTEGSEMQSG